MAEKDKPLVWLYGEVKTPPFSDEARLKAGFLLRELQQGENFEIAGFSSDAKHRETVP